MSAKPCKECDASMTGLDGLCLRHMREAALRLRDALNALLPYHQHELQEPSPYYEDVVAAARAALAKASGR